MHNLIYTTLAIPGKSELDTLLLSESIRTFGGSLANNPIWVLVPDKLGQLSERTQKKLSQLDAEILTFEVEPEFLKFPFAAKIEAGAYVEHQSLGETERLVFMDRDTLVLQEPNEFLITMDQALGYRPVHHKLIGSTWNAPLDDFWQLVYEVCEVPDENIFPMVTHTGERIRPYFNAGMFIVRPERGLLAQWLEVFQKWYRQPQFRNFYEKNQLYTIFIHQAIFTGVLLRNLKPGEMRALSPKINYPLHLHGDISPKHRPATINELVTARYENIFDEPGWERLPILEPFKTWLEVQLRLQYSFQGKHSKV
jgi:hypothetical protein